MPELDFERITLNAIPDGDMPVFHASQFETMRPFMADLKWGSEDFAPGDSCWCTLSIRKTDDTLVIIDDIELVTNTVSCILSQQAVACIGDNFCQLKVWATSEDDEDGCIACLNFILHVQPDPEADGITSESEINNLTEQIEEITQQVIGDDYYTKVQTDALLDLKADKSTTYTKTETDTLLGYKADASQVYTRSQTDTLLADKADKSTTYTKTQIDTALALKANAATTYTKTEVDTALALKADASDVYTKTEVDNIILGIMPVDSVASSPIASFNTALAVDLVDVKTNLKPSLSGYSAVNLTACGVNLAKFTEASYTSSGITCNIHADNTIEVLNTSTATISFMLIDTDIKAGSYILSGCEGGNLGTYAFRIRDKNNTSNYVYSENGDSPVITFAQDTKYQIQLFVYNTTTVNKTFNIMLRKSTDANTFYPYTGNTYTITFGQTVYGGVLDVTRGKLHVTWSNAVDLGSLGWSYDVAQQVFVTTDFVGYKNGTPFLCDVYTDLGAVAISQITNYGGTLRGVALYIKNTDYTDAPTFKTAMSGKYITAELATPFDIDLTPQQIEALLGVNNVYSDTGDTTVQFKDSIQHYIDTRV